MKIESFAHRIINTMYDYSLLYRVHIDIIDTSGNLIETTRPNDAIIGNFEGHLLHTNNRILQITSNGKLSYFYSILLSTSAYSIGYIIINSETAEGFDTACKSIDIYVKGISYTLSELDYEEPASESNFSQVQFQLVHNLLNNYQSHEIIGRLLKLLPIDPSLLRLIIIIDTSFHTNEYFNINLNLGYASSLDLARKKIEEILLDNKYLNSQDVIARYEENRYIIIKSFFPTLDYSRIYAATDIIAKNIESELSKVELLDVKIAYGSLTSDFFNIKDSYLEAATLISIGKVESPHTHLYSIENFAISSICKVMSPLMTNKVIVPTIQHLKASCPTNYVELLSTCRTYTENCMNFTKTASALGIHRNTLTKRLQRFIEVTGLDILNNYQDAMIATLIEKFYQQTMEEGVS